MEALCGHRVGRVSLGCAALGYAAWIGLVVWVEQVGPWTLAWFWMDSKSWDLPFWQFSVLHDGGLIHGDLTTSNILLRARDQKVVVIDFGLAHNSIIPEDKGVDLYVLERAITVTHRSAAMFEHVMAAYKQHSRQWSASFNKFAEVRMRGRKRSMIG